MKLVFPSVDLDLGADYPQAERCTSKQCTSKRCTSSKGLSRCQIELARSNVRNGERKPF